MQSARDTILFKIKNGLGNNAFNKENIIHDYKNLYQPYNENLTELFKKQFTNLMGNFNQFNTETDCVIHLKNLCIKNNWNKLYCKEENLQKYFNSNTLSIDESLDVENCDFSITSCESIIARTGTIVLSSNQFTGRTASVYAPIHICIAYSNQIVEDEQNAFLALSKKYATLPSFISFATGPSRTADIEKTLIVGVHGPKEVFCFLIIN